MGQSMAILRALGTKYGYYTPTDFKTAYYTDVVLDCWVDMHDKSNGAILGKKSPEEHQGIIDNVHVPALNVMEKQLATHGGKFIAGDKLTIADCAMVAMLVNIWENPVGPWKEQFKPVL